MRKALIINRWQVVAEELVEVVTEAELPRLRKLGCIAEEDGEVAHLCRFLDETATPTLCCFTGVRANCLVMVRCPWKVIEPDVKDSIRFHRSRFGRIPK